MIVLYIAIAVFAAYWLLSRKRNPFEIPGPDGLPLVGIGFNIAHNNIVQKFNEYAITFGEYFQVKIFHTKFVILNSERATRLLLTGDATKRHTNDRTATFYGDHIVYKSQSASLIPDGYGHIHDKLRKSMVRGLHFYGEDGRDQFERMIFLELTHFQDKLRKLEGQDVPIISLVQRSLSNVMSIAVCVVSF